MKNGKYVTGIVLSSMIASSAYAVESVPTLESLAAQAMNPRALAQQILDGTIDKDVLNDLEDKDTFEALAELVAKELDLLDFSATLDYVPPIVEKHFKGVSIQDLIDHNLLPKVTVQGNMRILDLQDERINSLEGYKNVPGIEQVHKINVSKNLIKQLPRDFKLEHLVSLNLAENQLHTLPTQWQLPQLQDLDLSWNQLETYPDPTTVPLIKRLLLRNNRLKTVPAISYPVLEQFDVANNRIKSIAAGFYVPNLRELNVKNNQLTDIPSIGAEHPVMIDWEGNQLSPAAKNAMRQRFPAGSQFIPEL